jgi:hypothetical protein
MDLPQHCITYLKSTATGIEKGGGPSVLKSVAIVDNSATTKRERKRSVSGLWSRETCRVLADTASGREDEANVSSYLTALFSSLHF